MKPEIEADEPVQERGDRQGSKQGGGGGEREGEGGGFYEGVVRRVCIKA